MTHPDADVVVAGAGVVGLAIARALAQAGREVLVLEAAGGIGTATSSRNSEVIHSGLYHAPPTLKARLCVAGRPALYAYCAERGVATHRCGKLVVATSQAELGGLERLRANGAANGVTGLRMLTGAEARALEPALACEGALLCPDTGILDSHGYMLALQGDALAAGASFAFHTPVLGAARLGDGLMLLVGGAAPMQLSCRVLVNAAGLQAPALARRIGGLDPAQIPTERHLKGSYFALDGRSPFSRLIYPLPVPGGAGIHLTLDLAGAARFGPDVEAVDGLDYTVDPARAAMFAADIRRFWPGLPAGALRPGYAGIRPAIGPGQDFRIEGRETHGVPGLVNLFGIESPGLTASLAIADHVAGALYAPG